MRRSGLLFADRPRAGAVVKRPAATMRERSKTHPVRIVVDPIRCDAFGYCSELLPELVTLDEWGYPVIAGEPVPAALASRAAEAVRQCPRRAMLLVRAEES